MRGTKIKNPSRKILVHSPISLVVFDVGNVLLWFDLDRAAKNWDRHETGTGQKMKRLIWYSRLMVRFETGKISGPDLFRQLKKRFRLKMTYSQFTGAINDIFEPVRANLALLRRLSRKIPTALLSNTNPVHWRHILNAYPDLKKAHWPFSSHLLGSMKPAAKIFQALSHRTGVALGKMLFIDDRLENILAARALGMKAVHFTGRRPLEKLLTPYGVFSGNGRTSRS